jgi:hypothetical protein
MSGDRATMKCDLLGICPRGDYGLCCILQDIIGPFLALLLLGIPLLVILGIWQAIVQLLS